MPENANPPQHHAIPMSSVVVGEVLQRRCVLVHGADAGSYLHSQLSNDINNLAPGESCWSFVLEPTGKINALVRVSRLQPPSSSESAGENDSEKEQTTYLLDTDANEEDFGQMVQRLERFKIRVKANFEVGSITVIALRVLALADTAPDVSADPVLTRDWWHSAIARGPAMSGANVLAVDAGWGDDRALDLIVMASLETASFDIAHELLDGLIQAESSETRIFRLATPGEREDQRIRSGWPAMGSEIRPGETIPAATGIVRQAASFTKGCYPGQELVERMDSRGSTAPQSLRIVSLQDLGNLRPGDVITVDGAEVGVVTSVSSDGALADVALAYVSRSVELGVVVGST